MNALWQLAYKKNNSALICVLFKKNMGHHIIRRIYNQIIIFFSNIKHKIKFFNSSFHLKFMS